jgi:hypothetical protein
MSTAIAPLPEPTDIVQVVAANVRAYAARLGYSQVALGRALGMAQGAVHARWRGTRPWHLAELGDVALVLGVSVQDLVTDPAEMQNPRRWIAPTGAAARPKGLEPPTF